MIDNVSDVISSPDADHGDSHFQPAKRRRTINSIFDLITRSSPEEVWSWIKILTETLKKYPLCLRSQDLAPLLQYLTELAQSLSRADSSEPFMDNLYIFAVVLMENEMSTGKVQEAIVHWSKIWDMLLRYVVS